MHFKLCVIRRSRWMKYQLFRNKRISMRGSLDCGVPASLELLIKTPIDPRLSRRSVFLSFSHSVPFEYLRLNQRVQSNELSLRRGWTHNSRGRSEQSWLPSDSFVRHKRRPREACSKRWAILSKKKKGRNIVYHFVVTNTFYSVGALYLSYFVHFMFLRISDLSTLRLSLLLISELGIS